VQDWLSPQGLPRQRLKQILTDKVMPLYEHVVEERAAA